MKRRGFHFRGEHVLLNSEDKPFVFRARFEERKTYEYLANVINFGIAKCDDPAELLKFASRLSDRKIIKPLLSRLYSASSGSDRNTGSTDDEGSNFRKRWKMAAAELKHTVLPLLHKKLMRLPGAGDDSLGKRLLEVQETFRLTDTETEILGLYYFLATSEPINALWGLSNIPSLTSHMALENYGHIFLGGDRRTCRKILSKGNLLKIQLLTLDESMGIEINDWCRLYLSGVTKSGIEHELFSMGNDSSLEITDFELPEDDLLVLKDLINAKAPCNILFYGQPGTGKTALAKTLTKEFGKDLLSIKISENGYHRDRHLAIYGTINLANKDNSIILVDEADDLLNTDSFFFERKTAKSWINNLLESHKTKIIWITNETSSINPSTMRRFSFSKEFKPFTIKNRIRVLRHKLKKRRIEDFFSEKEIQELCCDYSVDAGGIVNAVQVSRVNRNSKKDRALKKIRAILKSHESATHQGRKIYFRIKLFEGYSLEGLNTSHDLNEVINLTRQYLKTEGNGHSLSLLLYGLPGTGKSEFVHYLGNVLEKEVLLKRCSDIESKWVGETEKNIADAFQEARDNNNILFFDEADSFLYPRSSASYSWEKSFTNEILAQLDSFTGIVVFATNDIDGLDHAALRRFRFKIDFRTLTPDGNLHFYSSLLVPLVPEGICLTEEQVSRIKHVKNLTPGDFAVVKDQFIFADKNSITHDKMIAALVFEASHKKAEKIISGLNAAATS